MALEKISVENICKTFLPNKQVLNNVSLEFKKGEIHALLGQNGAGKSTLVKILTGLLQPTDGIIKLDGCPVNFETPSCAINSGIGIVHQKPFLANDATVFENICLHNSGRIPLVFNAKKLKKKLSVFLDSLDLNLNLSEKVKNLSVADKFFTAFATVLYGQPDFLILDEPWSDFGKEKKMGVFPKLKSLAENHQLGIILITHSLSDAIDFADRISVLKHGEVAESFLVSNKEHVNSFVKKIEHIVNEYELGNNYDNVSNTDNSLPVFEVSNLNVEDECGRQLKNVSFAGCKNNIIGIVGNGDGSLELLENTLLGTLPTCVRHNSGGAFKFCNNSQIVEVETKKITPKVLRTNSVGMISSDRYFRSSNPCLTLYELLIANDFDDFANTGERKKFVQNIITEQKVSATIHTLASEVSGGELQRLILARELHKKPAILILAKPEQGLDFSKAAKLKQVLKDYANTGATIIVLTRFADSKLLKSIFNKTYSLEDGVLSET